MAASMSASGRITLGDLPPSSSVTRLSARPALAPISRPTAVEPVKAILSTPGWSTSAAPVEPSPVRTLSTPGGKPTSSASSPRRSALSGVCSAGLSTIVQPAASAGRELPGGHQQREVPGDDLRAHADRFAAGVAEHVRARRRAARRPRSSWASRRSSAGARPSPRTSTYWARLTGLPLSSDSIWASSSACVFERLGEREHQPLAPGGGHRRPRARRRTPRGRRPTARSHVLGAGVGDAARSRCPLAGSSVANVRPSAASGRSAPISRRCGETNSRAGRRARRGGWLRRVSGHSRQPTSSSALSTPRSAPYAPPMAEPRRRC